MTDVLTNTQSTGTKNRFLLSPERLQCPKCKGRLCAGPIPISLVCMACGETYRSSSGRPVLLKPDNEIFEPSRYTDIATSTPSRERWLKRLVPKQGVVLIGSETLTEIRQRLDERGHCYVLVIGSGQRRNNIAPHFFPHECIFTDVDPGADVDIFCDGHDLPFQDQTFDAVIIHAVLEHVLDPVRVVSEIHRVLKPEGIVFSAVPFMQQVHEQAYDFTRFTLSGHRRLFRYFNELSSGMVAGPGTALAWSLEYFVLSFISTKNIRRVATGLVRICFFWLKYCDYLCAHRPEAMDGASGTYFIGTRKEDATPDIDIIRSYIGTNCRNFKREKMMHTSQPC